MKKTNGLFLKIGIIALPILVAIAVVLTFKLNSNEQNSTETEAQQQENILQQVLSDVCNEEVKGIFFSMFPLDMYNAEDFLTYRGINTTMLPTSLQSGEDVLQFLEQTLAQPQYLEAVYIGLSKEQEAVEEESYIRGGLFQVFEKNTQWEEKLLEIIKAYPEKRFHIILDYPSVYELAEMNEIKRMHLFKWYEKLAQLFTPQGEYQNMTLFLPGAEPWLICNKANYLENGQPNKDAAKFVLGQIICVDRFTLNSENCNEKLTGMKEMIEESANLQETDSEYTYVFFGDSVIGNYTDSMSIPGVVSGYTDARIVNCGYGGLSAAKPADGIGFANIIDAFLAEDIEVVSENATVTSGFTQFSEEKEDINTEKLVFFISFGINDYASGYALKSDMVADVTTYKGALEYAVAMLKAEYPSCEIVLMTPNFIKLGNFGTAAEHGMVYEEYVNVVLSLCEELDLKCIDVYNDLGITTENVEEYIADDCHPTEYGRYKIGKLVYEYISDWYPEH